MTFFSNKNEMKAYSKYCLLAAFRWDWLDVCYWYLDVSTIDLFLFYIFFSYMQYEKNSPAISFGGLIKFSHD